MNLSSAAFIDGESIPVRYTCDTEHPLSPPLTFSGIPQEAVSLALIVEDPDVPAAVRSDRVFDHWVLFNLPSTITGLPEGGSVGIAGANTRGVPAYAPPCPPSQFEPRRHRYVFRLFALDALLDARAGITKAELVAAMQGHILAEAQLMGTYERA
jgi:Raf kinase inhibitor-like YbhB/YbcL family protein